MLKANQNKKTAGDVDETVKDRCGARGQKTLVEFVQERVSDDEDYAGSDPMFMEQTS